MLECLYRSFEIQTLVDVKVVVFTFLFMKFGKGLIIGTMSLVWYPLIPRS